MIISVEGLDGVGKSSLAKNLARALDISLIEKLTVSLLDLSFEKSESIKNKIYSEYKPNLQAMYYLLGYVGIIESKKECIMDRGFISTYYFSYNEETSNLFDFVANNYGFPDLTILLYASIDERVKRISQRDSFDEDLKRNRIYRDNYDKYFDAIKKYNIPHIVINTENLTEDEVLSLTLKLLKKYMRSDKDRKEVLEEYSIDSLRDILFQKKLINKGND